MTPEQTLDWLAEQHKSQCNEDRPVQEWIRSMKSMLPAPTVQEPVGYTTQARCFVHLHECTDAEAKLYGWKALYTTPPAAQRQWVGLTDKEMYKLWLSVDEESDRMAFGEAVQAKLKEKNTP